ncbi:MAG TPA: hypothetical protein VLK34_09810, partial [Nocardioidaceae bacterium]|nr:hypothetical protein [Nocardioidaceae bacterium]
TSWGIEASRAIAGTLMNMIAFYMMRFSVPILGFLILLPVRYDSAYAVSAAIGVAVGGSIVGIVFLGLRSEQFAEKTGRVSGRLASKVKKSIDPDHWAAATVQFRNSMKETFAAGFPKSAIGLVALVVSDATILLLSLRFVGVSASEMPAIELYAAFLCAYPLTLFPLMGLGIFDAVLLAAVVDIGGLQTEPAAVAALLVWRAITLAGPIALGAVSLALWKHSVARGRASRPQQ